MKNKEKIQKFSMRLKGLRSRRGLTQADLAAAVGVSLGAVGNWENETNIPSGQQLRKLADFFSVSTEFLIEGDAAEIAPSQNGGTSEIKEERRGEDYYYASNRNISQLSCPDKTCFVIEFAGDSMEPKYQQGDMLVVSPNSRLEDGDLVVAKRIDETVYFKIYHRNETTKVITLSSYNPAYPPLEFKIEDFRYIYPVWSVIRLLKKRGQVPPTRKDTDK